MTLFRSRLLAAVSLAVGLTGCLDGDTPTDPAPVAATRAEELDIIGLAAQPPSLLVLDAATTPAGHRRLQRTLAKAGGSVIASLPPRLVVAQVPAGAGAILTDLGVRQRFDRAVVDADLPGASLGEQRFAAVFSSRWYPAAMLAADKITPRRLVRAADEPFEAPARRAPAQKGAGAAKALAAEPDPDISVPFASGTVVVSIVLPESNGAAEPSTEDWTETSIRETQLKIQAALDNVVLAEPNADLRYIVHVESAPAAGGLAGTVDSDYEFGKHAQWNDWEGEQMVISHLLGKILGHPVAPPDFFTASLEYTLSLRTRYQADAAYFIMVAPNGNYTAGLRAHAFINGPFTVLDTSYGSDTFTHEFGHIFGAADEYCPDACTPPTAMQGYLGIYNANAEYRFGPWGGVAAGRGEAATSLMISNWPGTINGYTRGSWGWLDTDGDGVVEVRDTTPVSLLAGAASGKAIRLTGTILDQPASRLGGTAYSVNRIDALEYRIGNGAWFRVGLNASQRGRQDLDLKIQGLPAGTHRVSLRPINSVGNVGPTQKVDVTITSTGNAAPHLRLDVNRAVTSPTAGAKVKATALDLDGDTVEVRFDTDGNGSYDTPWGPPREITVSPQAGVRTVGAEARDGHGGKATATAELVVFDTDAPPRVSFAATPSLRHGARALDAGFAATASDPEGGAVSYRWRADLATSDGDFHAERDWGAGSWTTRLETPRGLPGQFVDLAGGHPELAQLWPYQAELIDHDTVALAAGMQGIWFVDIKDRVNPQLIAQFPLETAANRMFHVGNRLYVLGQRLTVVDVSDPHAPREVPQTNPIRNQRSADDGQLRDLPDGGSAVVYSYLGWEERVESSSVQVTLDHPSPADLLIRLVPSTGDPIVLWSHATAPGGRRTLSFDEATTPDLRRLQGRFINETWTLEIIDDQVNGKAGQVIATSLRFGTITHAVDLLPQANRIVGAVGNYLVVAGEGLSILDARYPNYLYEVARVSGTQSWGAVQVGSRVVWLGAAPAAGTQPALSGLAAVDLSLPYRPIVTRVDTQPTAFWGELARVGSRLYLRLVPDCRMGPCPPQLTTVGDAAAYAAGAASWQLGTTDLRVDPYAFGDDQALWTFGNEGAIQRYDVHDPAAIARTIIYPQSWAMAMFSLGGDEVLLHSYGAYGQIVHLGADTSTLSRVFRITVEARDAAGAVSRAYRTVHVVPYDHAPTITGVSVTAGSRGGAPWQFDLGVSDPDSALFDPTAAVRADWNRDGVWDTDWNWIGTTGGSLFWWPTAAGHYTVRLQVRDGFWAFAAPTEVVVDVP